MACSALAVPAGCCTIGRVDVAGPRLGYLRAKENCPGRWARPFSRKAGEGVRQRRADEGLSAGSAAAKSPSSVTLRVPPCAPGMAGIRGCKSPAQPDGGEVQAKRKGVAARRGRKEAGGEITTRQ